MMLAEYLERVDGWMGVCLLVGFFCCFADFCYWFVWIFCLVFVVLVLLLLGGY